MDIVKYLRSNQEGWHDPDIVWVQVSAARLKEAADEIERLRETLKQEQQIDFVLDSRGVAHKDFVIVYKNRATLKGDE